LEKGWVKSVAGRNGGYVLGKNPAEITMGQVVRHFDSILAPIACVSIGGYEKCSQEPHCSFRRVLLVHSQGYDLTLPLANGLFFQRRCTQIRN